MYYDAVKKSFVRPMCMNSPLTKHWFEAEEGKKGKPKLDLSNMQA